MMVMVRKRGIAFIFLLCSYTHLSAMYKAYVSMCNIKRSGDISMHCLQFRGFLKDDARFLKFTLAMNDNILMGDIKSDPNAKISW